MMRRKQEAIFSRLSGIEAEFETTKKDHEQSPVPSEKNEPVENRVGQMPSRAGEDGNLLRGIEAEFETTKRDHELGPVLSQKNEPAENRAGQVPSQAGEESNLLRGIEAEFETTKRDHELGPVLSQKNEPAENRAGQVPSQAGEDGNLLLAGEALETDAAVSASMPGEPVQSPSIPETAPVYCHPPGEPDIFAFLESSFVLANPGTFLMGSPEHEPGRASDEITHEVTITSAFHMQNMPVTQGLWNAVMGSNPASFRDGGDDLPVESISWNECQEFLRKLNSMRHGKYRLPTEAEWEYACRAGNGAAFANGDISELYCGRDPILWEAGWYCGNAGRKTWPGGRKNPNGWGLFDMHGNISEWCEDWYGAYPEESCTNPSGPKSGAAKVVRGGSWFGSAKNCRSASRFYWPPNQKSDFIGFRLVRQPS